MAPGEQRTEKKRGADVFELQPDDLVIVSVSGGKDSTATCLHLMEQGIEHERVFADTGWEARETYEYLRGPLTERLGPIAEVARDGGGMVELIRKKGMFPPRQLRFCTEELKVRPLQAHLAKRAKETGRRVVNVVGIRAQESASRAAMDEWDAWSIGELTIPVWRPLIEWTEDDVIAIHQRHDLAPNPLYLAGGTRVGCWPCIFARKNEIRLWSERDPEAVQRLHDLEIEITAAADARAEAKGEEPGRRRTWFAGRGPGSKKRSGRDNSMPILDVVRWAQTGKGGRQFELLPVPDDGGCVRWGMCEGHTEDGARRAARREERRLGDG